MKNDILNEISDGLMNISSSLSERIQVSSDLIINMKENLESLESSLVETKNYIKVLKENVEEDNNIFFVGVTSQENNKKLEEQYSLKTEIEEHIKDMEESIKSEEDRKKYMLEIADSLHIYSRKLLDLPDEEKKESSSEKIAKKPGLLEEIILCQRFAKIDHERCYIELSKVIEEIEKWEEN